MTSKHVLQTRVNLIITALRTHVTYHRLCYLHCFPHFAQLILLNPRNAALKCDALHSKSSFLFHAEQIIKHVIIKVPSSTTQQSFYITEFQTHSNSTITLPCA